MAGLFRLLAVFFSPGFAMSDDHFLVIHVANEWLKGISLWFERDVATGHSIIYPGLHYLLFYFLKELGFVNPQVLMGIVRFLHAAFSMLTVMFGYKIMLKISDKKTAATAGMLLAIIWFAPFMSVRNLIEVVCIPPMMVAVYLLLPGEDKTNYRRAFWAGMIIAGAFIFRYQSLLIVGGIGLVQLYQKHWKLFCFYSSGFLLAVFLTQGIVDWITWGFPFASLQQYVVYNLEKRSSYVTGPWYQYLLLLSGAFIPPVSLFLFYGSVRMWKRAALIFWPVLLFLMLHSYFPNKQERFILPVYPFILLLGVAGWKIVMEEKGWLRKNLGFIQGSWIWFWCINSVLLIGLTFTYGKKSQVELMNFFRTQTDTRAIIVEYNRGGLPWFPKFYLGREITVYRLHAEKPVEQFLQETYASGRPAPNYVFFYGNEELAARKMRLEQLLNVNLVYIKTIEPSFIDGLLHTLNPNHNKNLTSYIYKIGQAQ
jgi:hypothetical protein